MIELTPIFPTFFGKIKFKYHNKYKDIFDSIKYENINENQPSNWNSVVHTNFHKKHKIIDTTNLEKDLVNFILHQVNIPNAEINKIWYNIYKKGFSQEIHNHCDIGNILSGIYFFKNPSSPVFVNPSECLLSSMGYSTLLSDTFLPSVRPNTFSPHVEEGDIILFPSDLNHYVPIYNKENLRITFSFNVGVKLDDKNHGRRNKIW